MAAILPTIANKTFSYFIELQLKMFNVFIVYTSFAVHICIVKYLPQSRILPHPSLISPFVYDDNT